jgi:hypothetical protein
VISPAKLQRVILSLLFFLAVLYLGDYAQLKLRGAGGLSTVPIILGTPMKDGRVQIFRGDNQTETCVHSLFPHLGYSPCWYVKQNSMQLIGAQNVRPTRANVHTTISRRS